MNKCEFCGAPTKTLRMCADCYDTYKKLRAEDQQRERLNLRASGLQYENSPEDLAQIARKYLSPKAIDQTIQALAGGAYVLH